ncbi:putative RNA-directed DNA polymerase [Helianthus debilis subsp. tardiflorus]
MNFLSINVRGLGDQEKKRWVKDLRVKNGVDFLVLQETKMKNSEGFDKNSCWGRGTVDFDMVEAMGRSGGIISMWDSKVFKKTSVIHDPNFLLTTGYMVEDGSLINVLNVYAPQNVVAKRCLWDRLKETINNHQGMWVVVGDFNAVRCQEERKNSSFNHASAEDFNSFIDDSDLHEYFMRGNRFTYMAANNGCFKLSKIDRVLVCQSFFNKLPRACLRSLPRGLSDHSPLLLTLVDSNFGYKPFRWFNSWLDREGCKEVVLKALNDCSVKGRPDVVFSGKLKCVKEAIRTWWKEELQKEENELETYKLEIHNLETIMEDRELEEEELWVWEECKKGIDQMNQWKCRDLQQKSRVKWASKGDENSAYFHRVVNGRKAANDIPGLSVDGQWISKPNLVKREVLKFFRNHFSDRYVRRPSLLCENVKLVSPEDAMKLIRPFSKVEIREAVFDCGSDRAPGPDGFNFKFIKHFWNELEGDFLKMFDSFYETGEISRGCSTSFITLIPKSKTPVGLKDYRPITLVGVISKIISKVLAERVKETMGKIISETQTAFLKGRFILDGPLIINELYGWIKKTGRQGFLLKIDFEKAYDNVNWEFLLSCLDQMGFPCKWCIWVKGILRSARSAVLVNGSPTFEFQCQKGVRQGDPLSPFLFLIVMEAFSCLIRKATDLRELKDLRVFEGGKSLSHLLYADDALILGEWSRENIVKTTRLLRIFYMCSGLKINLKKSFLFGVGVNKDVVSEMANIMGCRIGDFPFDYLGIKVGANMNKSCHWVSVIDTIKRRLASWKANTLSMGGRLTLIKSVLASLPVYYLSLYKAPVKITDQIEKLMRKFLWAGSGEDKKMSWVAWDTVSKSKKNGGLGITKVRDVNFALLSKWAWRFKTQAESIWRKVVEVVHGGRGRWVCLPSNRRFRGCWNTLANEVERRYFNGRNFFDLLSVKVGGTDRWSWGDNHSEPMSVASVKDWIRANSEVQRQQLMKWESWIPIKVNLFIWRAEMGRIPTKEALFRRHINIQDTSCSICGFGDENVMHLFTGCIFANSVWSAVGRWCRVSMFMAFDFSDLLSVHDQVSGGKWAQKVIRGIIYISCWVIWKLRNYKVFSDSNPKVVEAVAMIKSWSFLWLKNRSKFGSLVWKDWSRNPMYML